MTGQYDILVVDEERVIVDSVAKVGESEGYAVDSANAAGEAFAKLESHRYRLIISDLMMPEMDGFRFLEELRRRGVDTPVIVTTGVSTLQNAVRSLLCGAIGFLPKPFTVGELMSRIRRGLKYAGLLERIKAGELQESDLFEGCPGDYRRLGHASWLKVESAGVATIGVMGLFLRTIDPVSGVELQEASEPVHQGNVCAGFETEKLLVYNLRSPVSGKIIARNERVLEDTGIVARDPYGEGWLYKVLPYNLDEEVRLLKSCAATAGDTDDGTIG